METTYHQCLLFGCLSQGNGATDFRPSFKSQDGQQMAHSSRRRPRPSTAPHLQEAERDMKYYEDMKTQKLIELGQPESACRLLPSDDESASVC